MDPTRVSTIRYGEVRELESKGGTLESLLGHVNTPDARTTPQVQDPGAVLIAVRSAVKSMLASNEEYFVKEIESLQFGLD